VELGFNDPMRFVFLEHINGILDSIGCNSKQSQRILFSGNNKEHCCRSIFAFKTQSRLIENELWKYIIKTTTNRKNCVLYYFQKTEFSVIVYCCTINTFKSVYHTGADPGFPVRGAHLKKCAERGEARKLLGYFV
jgi:hypothetical protein